MRPAARALVLTVLLPLTLSGCDLFGPSGPGTLQATVESPAPLGALVLELTGGGVTGFEGAGATRVYGARVSAAEDRYRVVLVVPEGAPLRFGIQVEDVGSDPPALRVVTGVSPENRPVSVGDIRLRLD